jgi:hypothetical protein
MIVFRVAAEVTRRTTQLSTVNHFPVALHHFVTHHSVIEIPVGFPFATSRSLGEIKSGSRQVL